MKADELRQKYLDFFKSKGHTIIPSDSLIPENDPTTLFTTAGMHPLVPYLMGENHPGGNRVVNVQKCIRTTDIDEVGDTTHHTFFEMMGNWSFGDYFKEEAIEMSWEFLTSPEWMGLEKDRLAVSVFEGDDDAPFDEESFNKWKELGVDEKRIAKLPKKQNWWGPAGETGPCGPDTEMFYWVGDPKEVPESFNDDHDNWVEIWNDVFMQFEKKKKEAVLLIDGMGFLYDEKFKINEKLLDIIKNINVRKFLVVNGFSEKAKEILKGSGIQVFSLEEEGIKKENKEFFEKLFEKYKLNADNVIYIDHSEENLKGAKDAGVKSVQVSDGSDYEEIKKFIGDGMYTFEVLKQQNVDTGMGLERMLAVKNNLDDNYKTELFSSLIKKIEELSGKKYGESKEITKAMRIIADHIKAAVMIMGDNKGISPSNTDQGYVVRRIIRRAVRYGKQLGITQENWATTLSGVVIKDYKEAYDELEKNQDFILDEVQKEEEKFGRTLEKGLKEFEKVKKDNINGKEAFNLYQTYGFPLEMTLELAKEANAEVDEEEFNRELEKHQKLSRTASAGKFKGGLADSGEETKKLHTAAHLMLAALRKVLGDDVHQRGSNITAERLRFDFNYPEKLTDEQKEEVEKLVNEAIESKLPVSVEEMSVDEARKSGAEGIFDSKYGDKIKVYSVGGFSKEICGGPHVKNTSELGHFKIKKEQSSSSGVRRIKAILE